MFELGIEADVEMSAYIIIKYCRKNIIKYLILIFKKPRIISFRNSW